VEIRKLEVQPYKDNRRVKVTFEITPFIKRPNIEIAVKNQKGLQVSQFSVVEAIEHKMDFTLHLREPNPGGEYQLSMEVFYADLPEPEELDDHEDGPLLKDLLIENKKVVAAQKINFKTKS
jgi:hypothetical protein